MKHRVPHDLDFPLAKKATEEAIKAYQARFPDFSPTARWLDDRRAEVSFSAKGFTLKGAIELAEKGIDLELFDVPFIFKVFQKKALAIVEDEIKEWIGKARSGGLT